MSQDLEIARRHDGVRHGDEQGENRREDVEDDTVWDGD